MKIGTREIGPGHPVFIVAESGLNHDGDLVKALQMVRNAKSAGADAFKIACFSADCFTTPGAADWNGEDQHAMFRRHELSREAVMAIADECRKVGLVFFGTPDCLDHAAWLVKAGAPVIKIGSDDLTNTTLIEGVARLGLPMILSTGMADWTDVYRAWRAADDASPLDDPAAVLHCVSLYPTPIESCGLTRMKAFEDEGWTFGLSDHTDGGTYIAAAVAVGMGAAIIEKHVTLDARDAGPDHAFSSDLRYQFKSFCENVRLAEAARGGEYGEWSDERPDAEMRVIARRSIVAAHYLPAGHVIGPGDLALKRPGNGLLPDALPAVVDSVLAVDVKAGQMITLDMLRPESIP